MVVLVVKGGVTMGESVSVGLYVCPTCGDKVARGYPCLPCSAKEAHVGMNIERKSVPLRNSDADPLPFKTLPDVDFPDWKYCVTTKTVYFAVVTGLRVLDNGLAEVVITNVTDAARLRLGDRVTIQHEGGTKA